MAEKFNMAMLTEAQINRLKPNIQEALEEIFSPMTITNIKLHPDEGFDGDPILRVYISYKGEIPNKGGTRAAAINSIRDILQEKDDFSFPVMTLIPQKNVRKRGPVA